MKRKHAGRAVRWAIVAGLGLGLVGLATPVRLELTAARRPLSPGSRPLTIADQGVTARSAPARVRSRVVGVPVPAPVAPSTTTTLRPLTVKSSPNVVAPPTGPKVEALPSPPMAGSVTRKGTRLLLDGAPFVFTGVNAPQAATDYDVNGGCGAAIDLDRLFAGLAPNSVVRVGFGQDAAINGVTGRRDWRALDRVIAAAERTPNRVRLILGMTNQAGTCDGGHWRGHDWYAGGYRDVPPRSADGLPRVSYWSWIHELVPRYAGSRAIAMWEPVGEPEAAVCAAGYDGGDCYSHKSCPADASAVLRTFFDDVGAEFHRMDPSHLVASGSLGGDQCGWAGDGSVFVQGSPGVDVVTFHDYGSDTDPVPPWLARRIQEAGALDKPIISEETGIPAGGRCMTMARRAQLLESKRREGTARGVSGFLPWLYSQSTGAVNCDYQVRADDPESAALAVRPPT